ncbi:MAG: Uma2 family endonuclease [Pyrinomonadaceae bacterium]|nr:Uma2 family endonuclease [Pyrinomonadaceae bacterium]
MTAIPKTKMSLEEYFEFDKNAEGNFEYFDGEIFEMSGVSPNHARIERNLLVKTSLRATERSCEVFPANLRLRVPALPTYRYPDLSLVCGKAEFVEIGGLQCLANPVLIVEVLSDSTEKYDQGDKFREYKSIESFSEYLLISSTEKVVVLYQKHNDRFWFRSDYLSGEVFHLNTLDFDINVDEIYQGVEFERGN